MQEGGEIVAARAAAAQARLAEDPALGRFLARQARQERFHARAFAAAVRWVRPKGSGPVPGAAAMEAYAGLLESAVARGDAAEALLGNQLVLEALGRVELEKLDAGLERRGLGFRRLRRTILLQEQAHHETGAAALEALIGGNDARREALARRAGVYCGLVEEIFGDAAPLFEFFDQDVAGHRRRFEELLPTWLRKI